MAMMASQPTEMTRRSSSDSSTLSNILVAAAVDLDSASERVPASTPPTSVNDTASLSSMLKGSMDVVEEETGRRPKRARASVSSYNLTKLARAQEAVSKSGSTRTVSGLTGRTLVAGEDGDENEHFAFGDKIDKALNMDWELTGGSPQRRSPRKLQRRPSVKDRVKKAASKVGSVLGKRGREVMEAGKRKFGMADIEESPKQNKILKELDMGKRGILDEIDLDADFGFLPPRPAKKQKLSGASAPVMPKTTASTIVHKTSNGKRVKKWQNQGLYVGQVDKKDKSQTIKSERPESSSSADLTPNSAPAAKTGFMTLPMFKYLDKTRDFIIPYDVFAPTSRKGGEKPKDWVKINRNRLVGDAKEVFVIEKLPTSACVCSTTASGDQACGDSCLNRIMQYECNKNNCIFGTGSCSNRAFADLAARVKKGGAFDIGVEVIKTQDCGYGVRSCRTFAPGQIIMEYTGEVISEGECQRRMREEYKDKQCYYLMELERGLVIDGTKGSMARFINHSCTPNCEVRMVKVDGVARMAMFAGEDGITTGQELTYDYNFDNFGTTHQKCFCGSPHCRGFLSKRLNAVEFKKMLKEDAEKQRHMAEQAQKRAEAEAKKKQIQEGRGSAWRGWVAVDDPEVKERLRAEKKAKEEAAMTSTRAQRLAARRETISAPIRVDRLAVSKTSAKRRKTLHMTEEKSSSQSADEVPSLMGDTVPVASFRKETVKRTTSSGSKFREEITRSVSTYTNTSTIMQENEITSTSTEVHRETIRLLESDGSESFAGDDQLQAGTKSHGGGLARTASKGKEVMKTVSHALKESLMAGVSAATSSSSRPAQSQKLKQSKLSFGKL